MSNYRAIAAMSATLRNIVQEAVQEVVPGTQVLTRRPENETDKSRSAVFIFLYQAEPNPNWRNMELPVRRLDGSLAHQPQIALDLHYLLTFYGDEETLVPQLLLGRTAMALHAQPYPSPGFMPRRLEDAAAGVQGRFRLWDSGLPDQASQIQVIPEPLGHEELSRLWPLFFRVPYVLSAAYRVSVILITDDEIPEPSLPVIEPRLYSVSQDLPEIDRVVPQQLVFGESSCITLRGRNLAAAGTSVQVGGRPAGIRTGSGGSLVVTLPTELVPGVQRVRVARDVEIGKPPSSHRVFESNVASFVLRPVLAALDLEGHRMLLRIEPMVAGDQRAMVLLNQLDGDQARPLSFSLLAEPSDDGEALVVQIAGVDPGTYLIRVAVDGVTTPLYQDPDPASPSYQQFIGPKVEIP